MNSDNNSVSKAQGAAMKQVEAMDQFRPFVIDQDIVSNVLLNQVGTVKDGCDEGIQNGWDGGATKIDITITTDSVIIVDNGSGMTQEEIDTLFTEVGNSWKQKLSESQKKKIRKLLGKFGIGRFQLFGLGVTDYYTQEFHMHVDITDLQKDENGQLRMGFWFSESEEKIEGCKVVIKLFDDKKLDSWDVRKTVRLLKRSFILEGCEITINGEKAYQIPDEAEKIEEDGFIAYKHDDFYESRLYNLGAYIKDLPELIDNYYIFAETLSPNIARNEIIDNSEKRKLQAFIDRLNVQSIMDHDKRQAFHSVRRLLEIYKRGSVTLEEVNRIKFIKGGSGSSYHSINGLERIREKTEDSDIYDVSMLSDRDKSYAFMVFAASQSASIEVDRDTSELLQLIGFKYKEATEKDLMDKIKMLREKKEGDVDGNTVKKQRIFIKFMQYCSEKIGAALNKKIREIEPVVNTAFEAETDGHDFITVNMDHIVPEDGKHSNKSKLVLWIIHCYTHDDSSEYHDSNFNEEFHANVMLLANLIGELVGKVSLKKLNE